MNSTSAYLKAVPRNPFKYDKDFVKKKSVAEMTDLMCQESTAHGIGHTWNNRHNCLGVFWLFTTLSLFSFLIYVTVTLCSEFAKRDPQSQSTIKLQLDGGVQLPSVSLCNHGFFSRRKLQAMNISSDLTQYLIAVTGSAFILRDDFLANPESKVFMRESHAELQHILDTHNLTFSQLVSALSYRCEEVLLLCVVGVKRMNASECCSGFVSTHTATGLCHTYYTKATDVQRMEGEHMGVTFYANITKGDLAEVDSRIVDVGQMVKMGIQMTLISNHTHPAHVVLGKGIVLLPKVYTAVSLSLTVVKDSGLNTVLDWSETDCVPLSKVSYERDPQQFLKTGPNCDIGALRLCFQQFCKCASYPLTYPYDELPPCSLAESLRCNALLLTVLHLETPVVTSGAWLTPNQSSEAETCMKEARGKCYRLCERHEYSYTSNHLPVPSALYSQLKQQFSLGNGSEMAIIAAYYPDLRYTEVKIWRKSIQDLLSTLGGYTGVFLGCSFVTFLEFFVYIGLIFAVWVRNLNQKCHKEVRPAAKSPVRQFN